MTNKQRFIELCCYFERKVNEIEMEQQMLRNKSYRKSITNVEYLQKMTELEIRKITVEEVAQSVLQWMKIE